VDVAPVVVGHREPDQTEAEEQRREQAVGHQRTATQPGDGVPERVHRRSR
jgi:hypothetical protein